LAALAQAQAEFRRNPLLIEAVFLTSRFVRLEDLLDAVS